MTIGSETVDGCGDSDTLLLGLALGQRIRFAAGAYEGLSGTVVEKRTAGRILVQVEHSVFVEVKQYFLEPAK